VAGKPIRFVEEIGLYAFSRGASTCRWQTDWCSRFCYNRKFYRLGWKSDETDAADEEFWKTTGAPEFAEKVRALKVERFRFAVCGEIWTSSKDVLAVERILKLCPKVLFWIPTRAWQDNYMRKVIRSLILPLPNSRLILSIDPTVPESVEEELRADGFSLVFAGDNGDPRQLILGRGENRTVRYTKCVKTWEERSGHCAVCETGCFSKERVDVHLYQHQ